MEDDIEYVGSFTSRGRVFYLGKTGAGWVACWHKFPNLTDGGLRCAFDNKVYKTRRGAVEAVGAWGESEGMISPHGNIYYCSLWQHDQLCAALGCRDSATALRRRWGKLANGNFDFIANPTQPQIDRIFDWCQEHGEQFPSHWKYTTR